MADTDFTQEPDAELMAKKINQAALLFEEIADSAKIIDQICFYGVQQDDEFAIERYEIQVRTMREMVRRIGWMADLAASKIDSQPVHGDAEQWLVHPTYATTLSA